MNTQVTVNDELMNSRRILPALQYKSNTFEITKTEGVGATVEFKFRPTNCSDNLNPITIMHSFSTDSDPTILQSLVASPSVTGGFNLQWNGETLTNIVSDVSVNDLITLLQSIDGFGNAAVTRAGDCAGYTYTVKWLAGGDRLICL